ncbi:hypothetical protein KO361_06105 [Candidatus Woesearchaeota archaeon]|nr:hypothetical protein [Candidatus Woesearchaeota archaeon]
MAEIKITYETLFDLLRREKGRNELQELENTFYEDVTNYITEKNKALNTITSRGEKEKINIQLKNIKKILKELYELREKKIINLATSKVRTSSNLIDTSKLLEKEKELYEEACTLLSKYKQDILEKITQTQEQEYTHEETKKPEPSTQEKKPEKIKIKIIHDLPRFLGIDKEIYGPYTKGQEIEITQETAQLLLDKKRAEKI